MVHLWPFSSPARASRWAPVHTAPMVAPARSARRSQANSWLIVNPLGAEPAAQDDDRAGPPRADGDIGERLVGRDQTAVAGAHLSTALRHDLPAVELPIRHAIGDAQRLERRGERDHREVGHEHEGEAFRAARQEFAATRRPSLGDGTVHGGALEVLAASMSQIRYYDVNAAPCSRGASFFTRAKSKNDADDQERDAGANASDMARQSARVLTGLSMRGASRSSGSLSCGLL